jgi:exodeoxyribonuclease-5
MLSPDYFRWLYTAFTRATETLYLVNWPEEQTEN